MGGKTDISNVGMVVSCSPTHRDMAVSEVEGVAKEAGFSVGAIASGIEGLLFFAVDSPKEAIKKLNRLCREKPGLFELTFHYRPVDVWCTSSIEEMQAKIRELVPKIGEEESWRMMLSKRQYDKYGERELIMKLTEVVDRKKVDLKNAEKVIVVGIIGEHAGIALAARDEILDVQQVKKGL
ncbi:hypothetical protein AUJ69_03015 [Candidatus Woesearchaeota archaeon CG1_02_47_18]|nr:MAG: hypothetical protein AUJ69_03015 [Candidatus Woesearchaeota archaeon CG1_02_47_18]HII30262.1 hypothetical protein [Candidatus Woesearchaeota archaeon]